MREERKARSLQTMWEASDACRGGTFISSVASGIAGKGISSISPGGLGSDSFDIDPDNVVVGENGSFFRSANAPP